MIQGCALPSLRSETRRTPIRRDFGSSDPNAPERIYDFRRSLSVQPRCAWVTGPWPGLSLLLAFPREEE